MAVDVSNNLVGFLLYQHVGEEGEILTFAVAPNLQGQKVGSALLQQALHQARQENMQCFFLEVSETQLAAQHLYRKYGFQQIGQRPNYYEMSSGNLEDAFLFCHLFLDN